MLESIFLDPEAQKWKQEPRQMPEAYEDWVDAQIESQEASDLWNTYADFIYPLDQTKRKPVLDRLWSQINTVRLSFFRSLLVFTLQCILPELSVNMWKDS